MREREKERKGSNDGYPHNIKCPSPSLNGLRISFILMKDDIVQRSREKEEGRLLRALFKLTE